MVTFSFGFAATPRCGSLRRTWERAWAWTAPRGRSCTTAPWCWVRQCHPRTAKNNVIRFTTRHHPRGPPRRHCAFPTQSLDSERAQQGHSSSFACLLAAVCPSEAPSGPNSAISAGTGASDSLIGDSRCGMTLSQARAMCCCCRRTTCTASTRWRPRCQ